MEANPISVILVNSDSKGDRLLFRFPYATDPRQHGENCQQIRRRNPYALTVNADLLQSQPAQTSNIQHGRLTGFTDEVLSTLFAVKPELCERKFELKVNDVRFVGHPIQLPASSQSRSSLGGSGSKLDTPSHTILINMVFALHATASHSIVKCYYDLSKRLGVALRHEEKRCAYVTQETKIMVTAHDEFSARQIESNVDGVESAFDIILQRSTLAKQLKGVFQDLIQTGLIRLRINNWLQVSFCLPQKVHQIHFHRKNCIIEPEAIDRCLQSLRPYHGILLLVELSELLESLPPDASPALLRLVQVHSPLKSLQTLSADADLTLAQVFQLTGHLVYWAKATIIYPLCESNVYVIAPDAPTDQSSQLVERFSEQFPGMSLLQTMSEFSLPTSIGQIVSPLSGSQAQNQLTQTVAWMLRHRLLLQLHTYVYFMATSRGLSWSHQEGSVLTGRGEGSFHSTPEEQLSLGPIGTWSGGHARSDSDASSISDDIAMLRAEKQYQLLHHRDQLSQVQPSILNGMGMSPNLDDGSTDGDKGSGLIPEELLADFSEAERVAILKIPAATNSDDLALLAKLHRNGYLRGIHHLEEIMYSENLRRSQLLQLLDKFRDVLVTCETEDPAISIFYSHL
ncbi:hypothetical protein ONE63_006315 [Megalurothrips usitatus]|uniref:GATOR complex protein NPRL3 n=1 Tax=Megalurothrips usitatus TaxID=439358 RepID=A0AAV7XX61_9NEOP|nr:hypothetical protein ONE63_006315 [Megalurothrips usitatus]